MQGWPFQIPDWPRPRHGDYPPQVGAGVVCSDGNSSWDCGLGVGVRAANEMYSRNAAANASTNTQTVLVEFLIGIGIILVEASCCVNQAVAPPMTRMKAEG